MPRSRRSATTTCSAICARQTGVPSSAPASASRSTRPPAGKSHWSTATSSCSATAQIAEHVVVADLRDHGMIARQVIVAERDGAHRRASDRRRRAGDAMHPLLAGRRSAQDLENDHDGRQAARRRTLVWVYTASSRMSGLPSAIVLDPDLRAARMLELGLARAGGPVTIPATDGALDLTAGGVIVVGDSLDLLRRARAAAPDAPILCTGSATRADAEAAGGQ